MPALPPPSVPPHVSAPPPAPASPAPVSISPIVDADYRIHVNDLEGAPRQVEIANVTFQGVEAMLPVLHLVGQTKRLVMTPAQVEQIIEITGTVLMDRWVGTAIVLYPISNKRESRIEIRRITPRARERPMPTYVSDDRRGWMLAFGVVGLILCGSIVATILNYQAILALVQELQQVAPLHEYWPLR